MSRQAISSRKVCLDTLEKVECLKCDRWVEMSAVDGIGGGDVVVEGSTGGEGHLGR